MLGIVGFVLVGIGLSLCLIVVKGAFRDSWRHVALVLIFLPVAAPLYVLKGYTGNRFALGLGMALTLGLGTIALRNNRLPGVASWGSMMFVA